MGTHLLCPNILSASSDKEESLHHTHEVRVSWSPKGFSLSVLEVSPIELRSQKAIVSVLEGGRLDRGLLFPHAQQKYRDSG